MGGFGLGGKEVMIPLKNHSVWLENWSRIPKYDKILFEDYVKWLLKYYPKNLRGLNLLTLSPQHDAQDTNLHQAFDPKLAQQARFNVKIAKNRAISRYKKDYFKNLGLEVSERKMILKKTHCSLEALKICQTKTDVAIPKLYLKKILTNNKRLKTLEILCDSTELLVMCLKYSRSVKILLIRNVPFLSFDQWKFLLECHPYLENFSIGGDMASKYSFDKAETLQKVLEAVVVMQSLKIFQYDGNMLNNQEYFFDKLSQKKAIFDIRQTNLAENVEFSNYQTFALENIDFLAINNQILNRLNYIEENSAQEHLACQRNSKNLMFLHLPFTPQSQLLPLFHLLKNISVLDLSLSKQGQIPIESLSALQLQHLRHLFITIRDTDNSYEMFFDKIAQGLQGNSSFSSMVLEIQDIKVLGKSPLKSLLSVCANVFTKLLLRFRDKDGDEESIKSLYQSINQLKSLKSLHIHMMRAEIGTKSFLKVRYCHFMNLEQLLLECDCLEELNITFQIFNTERKLFNLKTLKNLKNLRKLCLEFGDAFLGFDLSKHLQQLANLTHVEFCMLNVSRLESFESEIWNFFKGFLKIPRLEVIKIQYESSNDERDIDHIRDCSEKLLNEHPALRFILLEDQDTEVTVLNKKCFWREVHDLLSEDPMNIPEIKCYKMPFLY